MKKSKRDWERIRGEILLGAFVITLIAWLFFIIYQTFLMPEKPEETIKFEVIGIVNGTEANTLVQVHYECIKYCLSHTDSNVEMEICFKQCALLGKEGCEK